MNQPGSFGGDRSDYTNVGGLLPEGRERGARRKKLAGYLKAANELRQSYQQSYAGSRNVEQEGDNLGIPGAFPDVSITRHGDEELILFPSYCKRHTKEQPKPTRVDSNMSNSSDSPRDAEYWRREWEKFEDDKAIVDVDVRGWVYSPHKGQMTRKNRLLIGLARQLSGIPAQKGTSQSRESSPDPVSLRGRHEAHQAQRDQERISREAAEILEKGEDEAAIAAQGRFSENPAGYDSDEDSLYGDRGRRSGSVTPGVSQPAQGDAPGPGHLPKRASWNQPSDMNAEELATANSHLMARLMPFMTNPLVSTPITVFFYDEKTSQSKTVITNEAGHFSLRAALDFIPTHVRVLASENLSATAEIKIMEPKGVSLISDVDDTIKHSSIGAGAREIFRNAFIRDLADLTIEGVKEWYNTMYDMGVGIHYVSNSPWQLFPVLVSFFQVAGLPPGSYHLKQYSGMLQGIFEPVAERKKGTLERIMKDFPERRFLLIGDSGEADLEVYTDIALAHPGRVIGVFIRDVTTPEDKGFFDSAMGSLPGNRRKTKDGQSRKRSGDSYKPQLLPVDDSPEKRPPLPARIMTEATLQTSTGPAMGNLIDFDEEPEQVNVHEPHKTILPRSMSDLEQLADRRKLASEDKPKTKTPPLRPAKPISLRSNTTDNSVSRASSATVRSSPPPPPPSRTPRAKPTNDDFPTSRGHPLSQTQNLSDISTKDPNQSYIAQAREKVSSVYNSLPSASSYLPGDSPSQRPLPPPRRGITTTAASYLPSTNRLSWHNNNSVSGPNSASSVKSMDSGDDDSSPDTPPVNKKLDLWRRRWRRAQELLNAQGVELRSWRKGQDVCDDAVKLVEKKMRELGVEGYGDKATSKGKTGEGGGEVKVKDLKRQ